MEHHVVKVPPDLIVDPRDTTLRHALRQAAARAAAWREERNQAHLFCAGPQIYVNFEKKGDYDRAWACLEGVCELSCPPVLTGFGRLRFRFHGHISAKSHKNRPVGAVNRGEFCIHKHPLRYIQYT